MADEMAPYRLEQAKSDRSTCTVSKEKIAKGEIRFGSLMKIGGKGSYKWRKLEHITAKQVANIMDSIGGVDKIDGFGDLSVSEQSMVADAFKAAADAAPKPKSKAKAKAKADSGAAADKTDEVKTPPAKKPRTSAKAKALAAAAAAADGPVVLPAPLPELTEALTEEAHKAIDLAKAGKWKPLFDLLKKSPGLANARPEVRDFGLIHHAAYYGKLDVLQQLLDEHKLDPRLLTKSGKSAEAVAKEEGHAEVAAYLAARVAKLPAGAPASAPLATPEKLARKGSSIEITPTPKLSTAIVSSAHKLIDHSKAGRWGDVWKLLDTQRELTNVRPDVREYGALHQAAYLGHFEAAQKLVNDYGADVNMKTKSGLLPEDVAKEEGHSEVAEFLSAVREGRREKELEGAEEKSSDLKMVQMPDGSWKVVYVGGGASASSSSSDRTSAVTEPTATSTPPKASTKPASDEEKDEETEAKEHEMEEEEEDGGDAPTAMEVEEEAAGKPEESSLTHAPMVDKNFPEACWKVVSAPGGDWLHCHLRQGSARVAVQQCLEHEADGRFCIWSAWGPKGKPTEKSEAPKYESFEEALNAFKTKFQEKTANTWRDRHSFKPVFGRWTLVTEVATPAPLEAPAATVVAEASPASTSTARASTPAPAPKARAKRAREPEAPVYTDEEAHSLIDLAKSAKWAQVYKVLDKKPGLVNRRPDVREYGVLHQAAYYGTEAAVFKLLDKYKADPKQVTKSGFSVSEVAKEHGHTGLVAKLADRGI